MIPPVVFALLALVPMLFRSRTSLCLEHLALRHQLTVWQRTILRPRLRHMAYSGCGSPTCGPAGNTPWQLPSRIL